MPFKSQKQARLFFAAANGNLKKGNGPSQSIAEKFIKDTSGQKIGTLPIEVKMPKMPRLSKLLKR